METVDPIAIRKNIAMVIRSRRQALGLDQSDLSALSGISQGALSRYETELAGMRAEDVPRLAKALNLSPLDFLEVGTVDRTGMDWRLLEAALMANFRSLPPVERLQTAYEVQAKLMAFEVKAATIGPTPDSANNSDGLSEMGFYEADGSQAEDSGLVSKKEHSKERETPQSVL